MPRTRFVGRVFPQVVKLSLPSRTLSWHDDETDSDVFVELFISDSIITVECNSEIYSSDYNMENLLVRAIDIARLTTNTAGFATATGLTVIFETVAGDDGVERPLVSSDPQLATLCTVFGPEGEDFESVYKIISENPAAHIALDDLVSALVLPHASPFVCGRAMDALKHAIASPDSDGADAWKQMREALNIERRYIQYIMDHSVGPRHGQPAHVPGNKTTEIARRSWIIMNRYLEYLKRSKRPLPEDEFPLLIDNDVF